MSRRFSREENAVIAKWREVVDHQSMSYEKVPSTSLLARIAGFSGIQSYSPAWRQVAPPSCLVDEVLKKFKKEYLLSEKVIVLESLYSFNKCVAIEVGDGAPLS